MELVARTAGAVIATYPPQVVLSLPWYVVVLVFGGFVPALAESDYENQPPPETFLTAPHAQLGYPCAVHASPALESPRAAAAAQRRLPLVL